MTPIKFSELFAVSPGKIEALRSRIERLKIGLNNIQEQFVHGGGKGGQKINKTSNCVILRYPPFNLTVRAHRDRKRSVNRFVALRELVDIIEMQVSPETSERLKKIKKTHKQKMRRHRRAQSKYHSS